MSESVKTVVLPIRLSADDIEAIKELAGTDAPSDFARTLLAEAMNRRGKPITGRVNPQGGKRPGAGRKPSSRAS